MKIKDAAVWITFDGGTSMTHTVLGDFQEWIDIETGVKTFRAVSGREKFIRDAETKIFIDLGEFGLRRYRDIKEVSFNESEREVT